MKKAKKVIAGIITLAMVLPITQSAVYAADGTGTTPVTYDTTHNIPDPDHPTAAEWAVNIPKVIVFTDDANGREVNADVTLVAKNGSVLPTGNDVIEVKLSSANSFNLEYNSKKMPYEISYAENTITGTLTTTSGTTATTIGKLQDGNVTITSKAKLTGNASLVGSYEDTLTYTVSKTIK